MKVNPNISLAFNGQCEEAFRLYERCMEGSVAFMMKWSESPAAAQAPPEWGSKIYHATLRIGDTAILGSDVSPLTPGGYQPPSGFDIVLQMSDPDLADRVFEALAEGATIRMPLQETFWAKRFGALIDRFGIPWSINCEAAESAAT